MEITVDGVKFKNVPDKRYGTKINDILTQSNIGMSADIAAYIQSEDFYTLVNGLDIDWDGIEIDNNTTINTTSDLIKWLKSLSNAAASKDEDKPYDPAKYSGLGRKTLQLKDGSNILTQEDFDRENTIYVIRYDFDLGGAEIQIPKGCVLQFEGGSISNGSIDGNNAIVVNTANRDVFKNIEIKPLSLVDGSYSQLKASMMIVGTKSSIGRTFYDKNGIQTDKLYSLKGLDKIYIKVTNTEIFTKGIAVFAVFVTENNAKWEQSPYINIPWHDGEVKEINIPEAYKNGYCGLSIIDIVSSTKYRRFEEGALLDYFDSIGVITNLIRKDSITRDYNARSTQLADLKNVVQNIEVADFSINTDTLVATSYFNIGGIREEARWYKNYEDGYSTSIFDLNELRYKGYDAVTIKGKMLDGDTLDTITCRYFFVRTLPTTNGELVDFSNLGPANLMILGNNTITIPFPSDANYLAFLLCNKYRTYIPASIVFKKQGTNAKVADLNSRVRNLEINAVGSGLQSDGYVQKAIGIGTWNIAHFQNGGVYTPDIDPEDVDTQLAAFKSIIDTCISKGTDIMGFNEFSEYFGKNTNGVIRTGYEVLTNFRKTIHFEQNYYADNTIASNIILNSINKIRFGNMPAVWTPESESEYSRLLNDYYIECTAYINNHFVYLIFTHLTWSGGVDEQGVKYQIAQITELVNKYRNSSYVAIIGDLNISDYTPFTDAGFSVANTTPGVIDNIVYKGLVVDNVQVIDTDLSDHKPLIARLTTPDYTPNDDNKQKIIAFGDSIIKGWRNGGKSFLPYIGLPYDYDNRGESSATLAKEVVRSTNPDTIYCPSIVDQVENLNTIDYNPDVIIIGGGINDYFFNSPIGVMADTVVTSSTDYPESSKKTVIGALEYIFCKLIERWPKARRVYVTPHKMKYNIEGGDERVDATITPNNEHYTATDLFDRVKEICKRYNVAYVNVYSESSMNTNFDQYVSAIHVTDNTPSEVLANFNSNDYCDKDGIHPSDLGYRLFYVPIISRYIK